MGSDIEDPDHARYLDRDRAGNLARDHVPRRSPGTDPRSWCLLAAERLERDRPEAALEAARHVGDPRFWAEVRGVAVPSGDVLRITPKRVVVREYPGRHQARAR
ncbi:hypothetical protein [Microtetraspora malaysiensis]|uniref:hypothetical protein n=1 Tax=Microtetraspora malaysiensis TaxID=161358 RepID=UPI003D91C9E7